MAHAVDAATAADRDAKIEQLLLTGLDHYFAAQYQQAINVWTRALFLDRSHARARAYIERARSAMAERQRQSEEMLQHGVDAFHRGEGGEARRLLHAAIDSGAPSEEALAVLGRLDRLEPTLTPEAPAPDAQVRRSAEASSDGLRGGTLRRALAIGVVAAVLAGGGYAAVFSSRVEWLTPLPAAPVNHAGTVPRESALPVPRRGDAAVAHARALVASGHLHDALAVLDEVRPADPRRPDADRLRGDIQRQLLAVTPLP